MQPTSLLRMGGRRSKSKANVEAFQQHGDIGKEAAWIREILKSA